MTKLALTHRDLGLSADRQGQNLKVWHCGTRVLPCQDAEAKMRSDPQGHTDRDRTRAQASCLQVTCVFWDQIMSTCWSLGRAPPPNAGVSFEGLTACARPARTALTFIPSLVTVYFPFLSPASHVAWELCWGAGVERSGAASLGRCNFQFTAAPSPSCFLSLSIGSASCGSFSPSGWQPQQAPAWGGLAAVKKSER